MVVRYITYVYIIKQLSAYFNLVPFEKENMKVVQ